jgi:hypothetical protein
MRLIEKKTWTMFLTVPMLVGLALSAGASSASAGDPGPEATTFASAQQVESSFRGKSFMLGDDNRVAIVRALDWDKERSIRLPFWLGTGKVVAPADKPQKGGYYVISEAYLVRKLGGNEWLIRAGSMLQKPDAVLVTSKTRYRTTGVILPTIVQYMDTRTFTREDGSKIDVAVLHEVSLPAKLIAGPGRTPQTYAKFSIR